jgi:hypothetical protein
MTSKRTAMRQWGIQYPYWHVNSQVFSTPAERKSSDIMTSITRPPSNRDSTGSNTRNFRFINSRQARKGERCSIYGLPWARAGHGRLISRPCMKRGPASHHALSLRRIMLYCTVLYRGHPAKVPDGTYTRPGRRPDCQLA